MFVYLRRAQYHETDKMGIIHHSNYVKWMEEARIAFLAAIGLPYEAVEAQGIVSPVTGLTVEYRSPTTFGDEVAIAVSVARYTGVQLELNYEMRKGAGDVIVATASSRHCFLRDGRIVPLKKSEPAMHALLQAAAESDAD